MFIFWIYTKNENNEFKQQNEDETETYSRKRKKKSQKCQDQRVKRAAYIKFDQMQFSLMLFVDKLYTVAAAVYACTQVHYIL